MIVDSHQHVILQTVEQIRQMDKAGIDKTVLFATTPHPETARNLADFEREFTTLATVLGGKPDVQTRKEILKRTLRELREAVNGYPDRFLGFGPIPTGLDRAETNVWIEENILANGFKGIGEISPANGAAEGMESLFQASADHGGLPLWIHTFAPVAIDDILKIAALCKKYPTVPTVFGHMGGTNWLETLHLAKDLPNVWLDLSAVYTAYQPYYAMRELPERSLFSSDAPYGSPMLCRRMVEELSPAPEVTRLVLGGNALRLIGG
jgi:predicted TIM-barrel fold metal-dependent hydrolase